MEITPGFNNALIYDNFIGIKCFSNLIKEELPNINIFSLIFDEVIHLFYLGDMNSLASHEYILQIARIDKSAFKSNAIVLNGS